MTTFPLPLPSTQPEPQPAVDLGGGTVATLRCAGEVAPFARPVVDRYRRYQEAGETRDRLRTGVGFTFWQLRQDRETQFAITAPDYAAEDFVDATTDDLTLALWIEAAQADVLSRADVDGEEIDLSMRVHFTKAALTVVEKGRTDELVLVRRPSTSEDDSGWLVRTAEKSFLRNKEVEVLAGLLVQSAPYLVPLLTLPTGTVARVAGGRFVGAWATRSADGTVTDADRQLLDADGRGAGAPIGERSPAAPTTETIEEVVDGVTLRARTHPQLAPLAGSVLMAFAAGAAGPLEPGARLQMSYAPYTLEATDEGGVLLVTTPDFSSPEAYRERTTDDLTGALIWQVEQVQKARQAGVDAAPVRATETIAIQSAALDAIVLGEPSAFIMERYELDPGTDTLTDGTRRSGWSIVTPSAQTDEERALRNIDAGELQACDRTFGPYLALPVGSLLQFAGGELQSAHLVDQAKLDEVLARGEYRTMGEVLASGEASRPLFVDAG
ncbi:hypothetical protein B277_13744 [Janibacter hoylei PVAS-1]|uniref:Uncharacterized protein n=1 Tax=Janibacter hoylei PVAS-1 TaxID=1210046 RepID=K1ELS4_9MICO|nr:hypothetical protein [Janibacter hoylei]EKA60228.1 hypothetical protein B277_13744 [Janibacter hoylei PVAS-1]RWU83840.1 hypothetical protein CWN80_08970 [Janibacter hoylei PVAS-1]